MAEQRVGRVVQVIGPVLDVEFPEGHLPAIYNAVVVKEEASKTGVAIDVIAEVAQHLGENRVRCISMKPTDGMVRGMKAIDTGAPISIAFMPRTMPSVGFMEMHRTRFSPRCCATSAITSMATPVLLASSLTTTAL